MKKNTIKAFTLVEMLIVIVIIGILIASLMPRMQSAQWRARDVARKNDLSQVQTAIITSQVDKWKWPENDNARNWTAVETIKDLLLTAWMSSVPKDPNGSNAFTWLNGNRYTSWDYAYMVAKRSSISDGWFILMAKTETEWWSNWVRCEDAGTETGKWYIYSGTDLAYIHLCTSFTQTGSEGTCTSNTGDCVYKTTEELRYILMY